MLEMLGSKIRNFLRLFLPRSSLLVFGSSILWGQGHIESGKIGSKVAVWIQTRFRERVSVYQFAHSGAHLTGDQVQPGHLPHGEVPHPWPSVLQQVKSAPRRLRGKVRVLIEGGINEVGGVNISNPRTSPDYIAAATQEACYQKLGVVLDELSERFPAADIFVLGYYQILADRSNSNQVREMLHHEGITEENEPGADNNFSVRAIANTRLFRELSDQWIEKAVLRVASRHAGRCVFVRSGISGQEGMFGNPSLLFHPWEKDPMMSRRARACTLALGRRQTGLHCYIAATAHPDSEGTDRYVAQITEAMTAL